MGDFHGYCVYKFFGKLGLSIKLFFCLNMIFRNFFETEALLKILENFSILYFQKTRREGWACHTLESMLMRAL